MKWKQKRHSGAPPKLQGRSVEGEGEMKVGWTAGGDDRVRSGSALEV